MTFDWRDPEQLHVAAVELHHRSRAAQGLPPHIEDDAVLDQLAVLADPEPVEGPRQVTRRAS